MKKTASIPSVLTSAVLAFLIATASVGCFFTAFSLPSMSYTVPLLIILAMSLVGAFSAKWRFGFIVWIVVLAAFTWAAIRYTSVIEHVEVLLTRVSKEYNEAYGWDVIGTYRDSIELVHAWHPLCLLGSLLGSFIAFSTVRGWSPLIAATVSFIPVIPCLVVTDTPPKALPVFVWIAAVVILVLSVSGFEKRCAPRVRRTAATAMVTVVVIGILFTVFPSQAEYDKDGEGRDRLIAALGLEHRDNPHLVYQFMPTVDLSEAGGPRGTKMIMKIMASRDRVVYVREQDYNLYNGYEWNTEPHREENLRYGSEADWYLTIQTPEVYAKMFFPYYPAHRTLVEAGHQRNTYREVEYTWKVNDLPEDWKAQVNAVASQDTSEGLSEFSDDLILPENYEDFIMVHPDLSEIYWHGEYGVPPSSRQENGDDSLRLYPELYADAYSYGKFLELPVQTDVWATPLVNSILTSSDVTYTQKADAIAAYVANNATYSRLATTSVAEGEDFAKRFLTEEKKGCCVHFATTTAVLLRAAGIPARYVTGYTRWANRLTWTAVTEEDAHAWVEYYEPRLDRWVLLDPTPVNFEPVVDEPEETEESKTITTTVPQDEQTQVTAPTQPVETGVVLPWKEIGLTVGGVGLTVGAIAILRAVRMSCRRRRRARGTRNDQALVWWHETVRMARLLKTTPSEQADRLAHKAKFSQHTLSEEELTVLINEARDLTNTLKTQSLLRRVWYRVVLCLY